MTEPVTFKARQGIRQWKIIMWTKSFHDETKSTDIDGHRKKYIFVARPLFSAQEMFTGPSN